MAPTALLSVSDKRGLVPLAEALHHRFGYQLLSSGGTAKVLKQAGLPVTPVADHTGAPEILGGRVKTLHPRIHGGILARRGDPSHEADLIAQEIAPIDVVVVNLYPFRETVADPAVSWDTAIENIDIGGPTMVRSAAKNHAHVAVLTAPDQYDRFWQRWMLQVGLSRMLCVANLPWRLLHIRRLTTLQSPDGCRSGRS